MNQQATVLTMTHFLTRPELDIDWTIPGVWDYIIARISMLYFVR